MVDRGDTSFVLGIKIHRDRSQGILGLSQKGYINKVLKRFGMQSCKPIDAPVSKGDKCSLNQCPKGDMEILAMKETPYASVVGSLMYAQVCISSNIAYIVGMLDIYLSSLRLDHWKTIKLCIRYLQKITDYMLT